MFILAFDTTSLWGGVAIFHDAMCLAQLPQCGLANYSVALFEATDLLLAQAHLRLSDMDLFAAANGPGSFTGIRVGLAAAQGWSHAFGKPLRAVSVLDAMVRQAGTKISYVLPVMDARRSEIYARLFRRSPASQASLNYAPLGEGFAVRPERLQEALHSRHPGVESCALIGRESDVAAQALRQSLSPGWEFLQVQDFLVPSIASLASSAEQHQDPILEESLSACYIRRPDAEPHSRG